MLIPNVPIIIAATAPTIPSPSGFETGDWKWWDTTKQRWYDYDDGWVMQGDEPVEYAAIDHTHDGLSDLPDIITLLNNGVTGQKTVGGYKFTFNHGVLTGFEQV
jgi:hypothetical protein